MYHSDMIVIKVLVPLILQLVGVYYAVLMDPYIQERQRRLFFITLWLEASLVVQDLLSYHLTLAVNVPFRIFVSAYGYAVRPFILVLFLRLIDSESDLTLHKVMVGVNAAVYFTAFFAPLAFTITEDNMFHRGPMGFMCHVLSFIFLIVLVQRSLKTFYHSKKTESVIPIVCCVLVITAAMADTILDADAIISYLTITMVSCAVFYYIWLHLQFVRAHENSLMAEQRIHIMMSQIQPHFLYNTLSTIQALCLIDPGKAADTVERFGTYLRQNIDSLSQPRLIPIETEIEHTKIYTDIEQLRFPHISISYDIQDTGFSLPALTVQPLVENAIRHGVRIRRDGMISVVTRKGEGGHIIVIMDNGKGFDVEQAMNADDTHIGLRNVKERIEKMCGGTLTVDSTEGEGTTITIRIPDARDLI